MLSGNRNFEGRINPDVKMNYLASPPLCVAYALAGTMNVDIVCEPLGRDEQGEDVYLRDIWPSEQEIAQTIGEAVHSDMFRKSYAEVFAGDERWNGLEVPGGERFAWDEHSTYVRLPPYFHDMPREPEPVADIQGARVLALLGDSVTTDHISPAGAIKRDGPAGSYLQEQGVAPRDFNSYGSRRGNHEVMMRGTFANIRLRNQLAPGTEGGVTRYLGASAGDSQGAEEASGGEEMSIYDAAMRYANDDVPLVMLAGSEYGSGSSRDWAAKGTRLLGVRAVIAQSFERIHRSNLVGMGVLPLQLPDGQSARSLGLSGEEIFAIADRGGCDERGRGTSARGAGHRPAGVGRADSVRGAGAHRHPARGRLLPARRHPAVRSATVARRMTRRRRRTDQSAVPELLLDLLAAHGPSGYETDPAAVWLAAAGAFATVSTDVMGTPLALVSPKHGFDDSPKRLLVMGHIDEIGMIVTHIDDDGYLWFAPVGGWDPQILVGQRVALSTRDGVVRGVVGKKPIHLLREEDRKKVAEIRELHIDIGAPDGEQARKRVRIGDVAVIDADPIELLGGRLVSRALDNRIGSFVALQAARLVAEAGGGEWELAAVAVAQEEITFGGSRTSTFALAPHAAIVIDVTHATDAPGIEVKELGKHTARLGPGHHPRLDHPPAAVRAALRHRHRGADPVHRRGLRPRDRHRCRRRPPHPRGRAHRACLDSPALHALTRRAGPARRRPRRRPPDRRRGPAAGRRGFVHALRLSGLSASPRGAVRGSVRPCGFG